MASLNLCSMFCAFLFVLLSAQFLLFLLRKDDALGGLVVSPPLQILVIDGLRPGTLITSGILILTVEFVKAGTFFGSYVHKLEFESFAVLVFSDSFQEYGLNSMTCVLDFS